MSGFGAQEIAAIAIVFFALLYLVHRLTGFPRRKKAPPPAPVHVGSRLERGLRAARKRDRPTS